LDHQTGETLESTGNADGGIDLDQDTLGSVDENLKATGLVDGGVEEGEETLEKVLKKGIIVVKKRSSVL
jgi:hypothetical protein